MSSPHRPLNLWSTLYSTPSVRHRQQEPYSSTNGITFSQAIVIVFVTAILLGALFPKRVMDLVDAYMELPSFADIPHIIRDQLRAYLRRGATMAPVLVLRPFAPERVLTGRDRTLLSPTKAASNLWRDSTNAEGNGHLTLHGRLKNRAWNAESSQNLLRVPGLVNTGNFCFMNSVLQALASLPEFSNFLDTINDGRETSPVASSLADLLRHLNTRHSFSTAFHPDQVARALMQSDKNRLLATREQQDAQEFFSLLIDTLENEYTRQWLIVNKPPGLETAAKLHPDRPHTSPNEDVSVRPMSALETHTPNPFEGLSANRMGCLTCKYVENIRHEKFGPMVLSLTTHHPTTLEECLKKEFEMETLEDVECQKCTLLAYRAALVRLTNTLSGQTLSNAKSRLELVDAALKSGKIEDPKLLSPTGGEIKKFLRRSTKTKHHMVARPPRLLAFHIQRSSFHNFTGRALKNQSPVSFPMTLDISEYVTASNLSMDPERPISLWQEGDERTIYQLQSVIVHYGLHHIGHYVAYRQFGDQWFRISDEDVESSSVEEVLVEGARGVFMLMYELVQTKTERRAISVAPTVETAETVPEGIEAQSISEPDWPEKNGLTSTERPSLRVDTDPITAKEEDFVDNVGLQLEEAHISPTSSVTSRSDESLEQRSTRSTSFSSVHSRPHTPIFESNDPWLSPPPSKRVRRHIKDEDIAVETNNVE